MQLVVRIVAWSLAATIVVLSLVPSELRPETGFPHILEHFFIFAATGAVGAAKSLQPKLANTVADILDDQQRVVEKDLLSFRLTDVVLFNALAAIAFVPIKSFDLRKVKHVYYHNILIDKSG